MKMCLCVNLEIKGNLLMTFALPEDVLLIQSSQVTCNTLPFFFKVIISIHRFRERSIVEENDNKQTNKKLKNRNFQKKKKVTPWAKPK